MKDRTAVSIGRSENSGWFGGAAAPPRVIRSSGKVRCEEHFCEAELALRKQKCIPCAFSARERSERKKRFVDQMEFSI